MLAILSILFSEAQGFQSLGFFVPPHIIKYAKRSQTQFAQAPAAPVLARLTRWLRSYQIEQNLPVFPAQWGANHRAIAIATAARMIRSAMPNLTPIDTVVILARGLGTRMRKSDQSSTLDATQQAIADAGVKALIPVGGAGRPFLDYVLSEAAEALASCR